VMSAFICEHGFGHMTSGLESCCHRSADVAAANEEAALIVLAGERRHRPPVDPAFHTSHCITRHRHATPVDSVRRQCVAGLALAAERVPARVALEEVLEGPVRSACFIRCAQGGSSLCICV